MRRTGSEQMLGDEHGGADDMADADEDFEAVVDGLAPSLLPGPGTGVLAHGMLGTVTMMPGLGMGGGGCVVADLVLVKDERRILDRRDSGARGILSRGGRGHGKGRVSL